MFLTLLQSQAAPPAGTVVWLKVSGVWEEIVVWLNVGGTWKTSTPFIKVAGTWE
jgi:hypothetical protein